MVGELTELPLSLRIEYMWAFHSLRESARDGLENWVASRQGLGLSSLSCEGTCLRSSLVGSLSSSHSQ